MYARVDEAAAAVAKLAADALTAAGVPFRLQEAGSLFSIFLGVTDPVRDFGAARAQSVGGVRRLLSRDAGRGRVPAAVTVRGLVPVGGARRCRDQPDRGRAAGGGGGCWRRDRLAAFSAARRAGSGWPRCRQRPGSVQVVCGRYERIDDGLPGRPTAIVHLVRHGEVENPAWRAVRPHSRLPPV